MNLFDFSISLDQDNVLQSTTGLSTTDPATITYGIINTVLAFLGLITLILIIYAGFLWMTASGNEETIKKAQGILKGAIIGLIIVLVAYSISYYVFNKLVTITAT